MDLPCTRASGGAGCHGVRSPLFLHLCPRLVVALGFAESEAEAEAEFKAGSECTLGCLWVQRLPSKCLATQSSLFLSFFLGLGVNLCEE